MIDKYWETEDQNFGRPVKEGVKTDYRKPGVYLVLGCVHVPGHNTVLIDGICQMIKDHKDVFTGLALIGDFLDCATLSSYSVGKSLPITGLTLEQEYDSGNKVIDQLTRNFTGSDLIYLYGNHEHRWNRYMSDLESSKRPLPSPAQGLKLLSRGFSVYEDYVNDSVTLGNHLDLIHGQFFNVHCAKKHIDTYRGSVAFAHTHRIQMYIEGHVGGFNIGWLGDVNSPFFSYMPRGTRLQWQNGFAVITIDYNLDYFVQQIVCHNNKFIFNGRSYGSK